MANISSRSINDILDLSKLDADGIEIESLSVSPFEMLQDVRDLMEVRAAAKGLVLTIVVEGRLPETFRTDPTRVRQILVNVIGNAVKFTERGSVTIYARMTEGETPMLEIEVVDTGVGLSPEQEERIFAPFSQADGSTTRKFGGTGLGLSISRRLARLLDGDLSARCELGRGCAFTLTHPVTGGDARLVSSEEFARTQSCASLKDSGGFVSGRGSVRGGSQGSLC